MERPGAGVDLIVTEVDRAAMGEPILVGQADQNRNLRLGPRLDPSFADQAADLEDRSLIDIKVERNI